MLAAAAAAALQTLLTETGEEMADAKDDGSPMPLAHYNVGNNSAIILRIMVSRCCCYSHHRQMYFAYAPPAANLAAMNSTGVAVCLQIPDEVEYVPMVDEVLASTAYTTACPHILNCILCLAFLFCYADPRGPGERAMVDEAPVCAACLKCFLCIPLLCICCHADPRGPGERWLTRRQPAPPTPAPLLAYTCLMYCFLCHVHNNADPRGPGERAHGR
jgi:hypothetical protein